MYRAPKSWRIFPVCSSQCNIGGLNVLLEDRAHLFYLLHLCGCRPVDQCLEIFHGRRVIGHASHNIRVAILQGAGAAGGSVDGGGAPAAASASLGAPRGAAVSVLPPAAVEDEGWSVEDGEGWRAAPARVEEEPCRERVKANMKLSKWEIE
eukprot:SAG11_NODE_241_length_11781_cov_8.401900_2_plen_151_part_00